MIGGLRLDIAGRHEHFSDFGNKTVGKLTARYDFSPEFAIARHGEHRLPRADGGGRALHQVFDVPDFHRRESRAELAGRGAVRPGQSCSRKTSTNYSFGVVFNPVSQFTSTLDVYQIKLSDRIVNSGTLYYLVGGRVVSPLVGQAISLNGNQLNPTQTTVSVNLFTNEVASTVAREV